MQSEQIDQLATALSKAQGAIKSAAKSKENPFFKSHYADLPAVWDACRDALSKNGLAVIQSPQYEGESVWLETTLVHSSGQWMRSRYPVKPVKNDPQGVGSALTYSRRYALMAMVGVVADDEDDDGNAASAHTNGNGHHAPTPAAKRPAPGKPDEAAKTWAQSAEKEIRACKSLDDLRAWEQKNTGALRKLAQIDTGLAESLDGALADVYQKFNPLAAE